MLIAEFTYNNIRNDNTDQTSLEFNCGYHSKVFCEDKTDFCLRFYFDNKLAKELKKLIKICCQNLFYIWKL